MLSTQTVTLVKVENKKGTGKTSGKPYDFYTATVIDADANVFTLNLKENPSKELLEQRNTEVEVDIDFRPKGFDIGGTITDIRKA